MIQFSIACLLITHLGFRAGYILSGRARSCLSFVDNRGLAQSLTESIPIP
jgi:hypothetical protein